MNKIAKELLYMIFTANEHDEAKTINSANDILAAIMDNPTKLAYELSTQIEEFSEYCDVCPLCGENLTRNNDTIQCTNTNCNYKEVIEKE